MLRSSLLTLLFLSSSNLINAQTTHILNAYDMYFDPDTLYIQVGDNVEMINHGYHSATEVDSIDWVNNTATHNGGFYVGFGAPSSVMTFKITNPGTYYNICLPHANMGMKSIIIASPIATNIEQTNNQNSNFITSSGFVQYNNVNSIEIRTIQGKLILQKSLSPFKSSENISDDFAAGIYIATFFNNGEIKNSIKFRKE